MVEVERIGIEVVEAEGGVGGRGKMVVAGEEEGVVGEVALRGVGVDRVRGRKASKGNIEYRHGARENNEMKNSAPGIWSCVLRALMVVVRIQDIISIYIITLG